MILIIIAVNAVNNFLAKKSPSVIVSAPSGFPLIKTVTDIALENNITVCDIDIIESDSKNTVAKVILTLNFKKQKTDYFKNQLVRSGEISVNDI